MSRMGARLGRVETVVAQERLARVLGVLDQLDPADPEHRAFAAGVLEKVQRRIRELADAGPDSRALNLEQESLR